MRVYQQQHRRMTRRKEGTFIKSAAFECRNECLNTQRPAKSPIDFRLSFRRTCLLRRHFDIPALARPREAARIARERFVGAPSSSQSTQSLTNAMNASFPTRDPRTHCHFQEWKEGAK